MIERYSRPEMAQVWTAENKFSYMMEVELCVAEVQAKMGIIPKKSAAIIRKRAKFSVRRIAEIEKSTKHDVIAFVSNLSENVGEEGKYIHYGLTSSDVLDTATSLQLRAAGEVLMKSISRLEKILIQLSKKYSKTLCAGRTHGIFAEPTTFGYKMFGFLVELQRNRIRLERSLAQAQRCKLSGAVGTYSSMSMMVEQRVARKLNLKVEDLATQVVPRDRHAELMMAIALYGSGLERLAVELRHLQRSEVGEVTEGFSRGQKGSSAMPHKKNPISAENITGLARLLKSYVHPLLENVVLWHERDISHSSVERVILPDAFILADYMTNRTELLLQGLQVNEKKMAQNLTNSQGQIFSSHVLLAFVKKGLSREDAYVLVQRLCHSLGEGDHLKEALLSDQDVSFILKKNEIEEIFSGKKYKSSIDKVLKTKMKLKVRH